MNQKRRYIYLGYIFLVIIGLSVLVIMQNSDTNENSVGSGDISGSEMEALNPIEDINTTSTGLILQDVPFTSQAPFSEWGNIIYQEGCEEAATIMAIAWATGKTGILPTDANTQILAIADFEQKEFGTHMHASIHDITTTMSNHLGFYSHTIVENVSKAELIEYLRDGHIVMVPTSGRALKNTYYTPPGPRNHIILIIGYDPAKSEFITNDSGTKNGASYRYNEDLLFSAIGYYVTSATDAGSPIDTTRKSGIVISKVAS